ncbi:hypothetical protein CEUSTIGMA_g10420.t1 [Chlamydomonas eustigma]|uniref:Peptidase M20 dimerisation domain-containing protein n=1 Tax=Chlamydomonas eustigma TaxID=1157962 RepID=A0A250XIX6_9CHLO|nr:hypothetical protein CEUSTIGMA_g10420.t1 [Chlamydomonas eustigma]|eukprot:GAX82993.1 hypothetical protein CEUSTIGMA_g10420.t1 [Chlamydomonas eustigma]
MAELDGVVLDEDSFVDLLGRLIGEAKYLQNNPPELTPCEDRAARHVLDALSPYSDENGGPLKIRHITFVEGRGNIIGEADGGIMSFVGAHMDVVTANPETWNFSPFELTRDGDQLRGRGTTDCLGHVAVLTELFKVLGQKKPKLKRTVVGVWIANEENSKILGVGVDELVKQGYLKHLLPGPLYWVDTADSQPCIGTGGSMGWQLTANGKLFHSGLPNKSVNPIELAMEALSEIQSRFYRDFPPHPDELKYKFATPSTMKPTQVSYPGGSINQIPGQVTICGDCRLTPFYEVEDAMEKLKTYVDDINANITALPTRGPCSKYELPEEGLRGTLELKFFDAYTRGVACKLDSVGYHAMFEAFKEVYGDCKPFSITGSLPCIRELQDEGYDVQTIGFGKMSTYHANNEYCLLSDFKKGFNVLVKLVQVFNAKDA